MTITIKSRSIELFGRRLAIRLDTETWTIVDWISDKLGCRWSEWANDVMRDYNEEDLKNLTAVIRHAAMKEISQEVVRPNRNADMDSIENNNLMRRGAMLDDDRLKDFLSKAVIDGRSYQIGYELIFGTDENHEDFIVIKNGSREGWHFATLSPTIEDLKNAS